MKNWAYLILKLKDWEPLLKNNFCSLKCVFFYFLAPSSAIFLPHSWFRDQIFLDMALLKALDSDLRDLSYKFATVVKRFDLTCVSVEGLYAKLWACFLKKNILACHRTKQFPNLDHNSSQTRRQRGIVLLCPFKCFVFYFRYKVLEVGYRNRFLITCKSIKSSVIDNGVQWFTL